MKIELVGYTGFVGSNLNMQYNFDGLYSSKNIEDAYNTKPDILVYCGVPAQKFIANKNPEEDFEIIQGAIKNIKNICPKKVILISTIDIYSNPIDVDEDSEFEVSKDAYGKNRHYLENWIQNNFNDYLIVRLPALYGVNLKKNFIYDLINIIPSMLKESKYDELVKKNSVIEHFYEKLDNGFYKCIDLDSEQKKYLKKIFTELNFTALNFTDSRGVYQFYNLSNLWNHITIALNNNIKILNIATEPISVKELYKYIYCKEFENEISNKIPYYNFKTRYDELYSGKNGYIFSKEEVLEDIKKYINDVLKN